MSEGQWYQLLHKFEFSIREVFRYIEASNVPRALSLSSSVLLAAYSGTPPKGHHWAPRMCPDQGGVLISGASFRGSTILDTKVKYVVKKSGEGDSRGQD